MRITIATLILMLAAACNTNSLSTKMTTWQGSHIDELSAAWGMPDECFTREGRQLCNWSQIGTASSSMASNSFSKRPACVRTFEVDVSGIITGWRWRGDRCPDTAAVVIARDESIGADVVARHERPSSDELAVIEPADSPTIGRAP